MKSFEIMGANQRSKADWLEGFPLMVFEAAVPQWDGDEEPEMSGATGEGLAA
jgi:hypothetical protein